MDFSHKASEIWTLSLGHFWDAGAAHVHCCRFPKQVTSPAKGLMSFECFSTKETSILHEAFGI